jgi:excisionase family DNA binding protein
MMMAKDESESRVAPSFAGGFNAGAGEATEVAQVIDKDRPPKVLGSAVLTVDELAALLRVNRKTVYEALSRGEIPGARRIRGRYRIFRDAVIEWFTSDRNRASRSRRNQ